MMMLVMEGAEQDYEEGVFGYKDHQSQMMIMKGKRTKRQRLNSPLAALATTASSSSSAGHEDQEHHQEHQDGLVFGPTARGISISSDIDPAASPPTSADQSNTESSTEEEEDMANCLILLAQGKSTPQPQYPKSVTNNKASVLPPAAAGSYVYKCKTCDRCFHSFQALGGHRASHKKEKNINHTQENNRKALSLVEEAEEFDRFNSTTLSLQISNRDYRSLSSAATTVCHSNNKANKVHECSVCGAEFTSGQALGGHMRRHRTFNSTTTAAVNMSPPQSQLVGSKRPRDMLQLDLNLPAPEEERVDTKFPFGSKKQQVIVFSASPLVGCHY